MTYLFNRSMEPINNNSDPTAIDDQHRTWRARNHQQGFCRGLLSTLAVLMICAWLPPASAADTEQEVREFMNQYLDTFDNGYGREIIAHYDAPLMMLAPNGDLRTFKTEKDIRMTVKKWKMHMIRAGISRTEWVELNIKALSENTALASTVFDRYSTSGAVFQHAGATYSLRKTDGKWKIFLIQIHDPAAVIAFR